MTATELLISISYTLVVISYAPQWGKIIRTRSAEDVSPLFLAMLLIGLGGLQLGFALVGVPVEMLVGNAAALINALILAVVYLYVRGKC